MKKKIIRVIIYLLLVIGAFLLQNNLTGMIPYLTAVPNLLLIVTFSVGLLRGRVAGMMVGLASGLLMDGFSGGVLGYYTLVYVYIGYLNGILSNIMITDMILLPLILSVVNEIGYHLYIFVFSFLLQNHLEFLSYLKTIIFPEMVLTLICTVVIYGIIMFINRHLEKAEKKGANRFA